MSVIELFILFLLGCIIGWIIELFYRNVIGKEKINPGFLKGPYLPIWGFTIVIFFIISELKIPIYYKLALLIILPTIMELITGIIFKKYFKIELWDYKNKFLNWNGIICLQISLYWAILSTIYYLILHTLIKNHLLRILSNTNYIFFYGAIAGIFLIDTIYAFNIAFRIKSEITKIKEKNLDFKRFKKASSIFRNIKTKIKNALEEKFNLQKK